MKRKISVTVIIFFSAFMLNVSAMAFQQRYDRRDDDEDYDPYVIEMMDQHVFKYLRNTWFFEMPLNLAPEDRHATFFVGDAGFGNQHTLVAKPFCCCHLKFVLIEYIGFFRQEIPARTFIYSSS